MRGTKVGDTIHRRIEERSDHLWSRAPCTCLALLSSDLKRNSCDRDFQCICGSPGGLYRTDFTEYELQRASRVTSAIHMDSVRRIFTRRLPPEPIPDRRRMFYRFYDRYRIFNDRHFRPFPFRFHCEWVAPPNPSTRNPLIAFDIFGLFFFFF